MFEELDFQPTAIGEVSLWRRTDPRLGAEVIYEVKLGDEFLMSSLVTAGEIALADLSLTASEAEPIDIVVGGLGLGFTAMAALKHKKLRSMLLVEALAPVIEWHKSGLIPWGKGLYEDNRCQFRCGDFFDLALSDSGFDSTGPRQFDAIVLDIDHSPAHRLNTNEDNFYTVAKLKKMASKLKSGGVFSIWSNDPPDEAFVATLAQAFTNARAEVCEFPNPYSDATSSNTIYLATL